MIEISVETRKVLGRLDPVALVAADGSVWLAMRPAWWDLASWIFWLFTPSTRRARVRLRVNSNFDHVVRAVRVSSIHVSVRGLGKVKT